MLDQAEELRKLAQEDKKTRKEKVPSSTKPRIITVTSGKGGVGKSNFVVNVSIALQKMKKNVLIFDADMGMGNDDVLMGCLPKYSVYDAICENRNIEEVIIQGPFGVKLLPGGRGISKIANVKKSQKKQFIKKVSLLEDLDYIILDTGAGINRDVLGFIACCQELIIITTPEPTSLTDAYSLTKAVNYFKLNDFAQIIINKASNAQEGEKTFNKFKSVVNKFLDVEMKYLGCILEDKKLVQAVRNQVPFLINYPNSQASKDINLIASKLSGAEIDSRKSSIQDLFKKIFNTFS
ncbi:MinD/ParA family protein [Clostridium sp. 001]|uniref:MinD/ParA family protein n=1 Tax=Clostridium sp. 001 TaxID=1970093 RepID=UPI001C2C1579|nr:MinD/ParA family protein [Clostridium sp. 001]QXE20289.1 chromosome partitioning protein ParA [Clostridium sp. 001]